MIRPLRITDLIAYMSFRNEARPNHALPGPYCRQAKPSVAGFLRHSFALEAGDAAWAQFSGRQLLALAAVGGRYEADIWDVLALRALPDAESEELYQSLLERVAAGAGKSAVCRVFLRLRQESPVIVAAKRARYVQYAIEGVYRLPSRDVSAGRTGPALRPRQPGDAQFLFQLYCSTVPVQVREVEGMTLEEWRTTDGWEAKTVGWTVVPRCRRDFILESEGETAAWLQVYADARTLVLNARSIPNEQLVGVVRCGLEMLGPGEPITTLARNYQGALPPVLEGMGFRKEEENALLARGLAVRVPKQKLMPARISAG